MPPGRSAAPGGTSAPSCVAVPIAGVVRPSRKELPVSTATTRPSATSAMKKNGVRSLSIVPTHLHRALVAAQRDVDALVVDRDLDRGAGLDVLVEHGVVVRCPRMQ